jgi:hypothetical protein
MVKTIVHHLGLGDQIMLNGMVRHFAETDNVVIFVKRCHEESVRFMYRDIADKVESHSRPMGLMITVGNF